MKNKILITGVFLVSLFWWGASSAEAASFNIKSNVGFTVNILYGSTCGVTTQTWNNQGTWGMPIGGLPNGCYTWQVLVSPSGYHLEGDSISGGGWQQGGNVSWTVKWYPNVPPPPNVSVSVSPSTVTQGQNVTVSWSVSGSVTSCTGTGNWPTWSGQNLGTSGYSSTTSGGLTANPTTFGVSCTGPCGTRSDSKSVTVQYVLTVSKSGTGSGRVTGNNGINCGNTCSTVYNSGNMVGLDAVPDSGSAFAGWSSPCSGTGGCVFPIYSSQTITATFNKKQPTASITCNGGESTTIPYNSPANVSWSSTDTSGCTVSPTGWTGKSGSQSTGNLTSPQTYTVNCTGE